jgi:hypothetical protein
MWVPFLPEQGPPKVETGREWFERQPESVQRDILGDRAWEAWRAGEIELDDMVAETHHPYWGLTRHQASLRAALERARLRAAGQLPEARPQEREQVQVQGGPPPTEWELVRPLGGSTGAELVRDPDGGMWVRKRGASPEHAAAEYAANLVYAAAGVAVPETRFWRGPGGEAVVLTRYVDGAQELRGLTSPDYRRLWDGFGVDALLGNWDVVGLVADNILVRGDQYFRVDNGGSFWFRAQGGLKRDSRGVQELWTLRDAMHNASTARVFGRMGPRDVLAAMERVVGRRDEILAAVRRASAETGQPFGEWLRPRLEHMERMVRLARTMVADTFKIEYVVEGFLRYYDVAERADLARDMVSALFYGGQGGRILVDSEGRPWDRVRDAGAWKRYWDMVSTEMGGDWDTARDWAWRWNSKSNHRGVLDVFRWAQDIGLAHHPARRASGRSLDPALPRQVDPVRRETYTALHAATVYVMERVRFPSDSPAPEGHVGVFRYSLVYQDMPMDEEAPIPGERAWVSTSLASSSFFGDSRVYVHVPYHRVLLAWVWPRPDGESFFARYESETELVAALNGLKGVRIQ